MATVECVVNSGPVSVALGLAAGRAARKVLARSKAGGV